jgi:serine protease Do
MDNFNNENKDMMEVNKENYKLEQQNIIDTNYTNISYNKKEKKNKKNGIFSYVVVGLVCSLIGGSVSTAASLYLIPKSGLFKSTPLYQSISQNMQATQNASSSGFSAAPMSATNGSLTVEEIAKKVGPAVVGVSVKSVGQTDIFGYSQGTEEGMGSGIIINKDGYILTNYHVINGAQQVSVIFNNKKEVPAKVINYDAPLDLAIIKVTGNVQMPAVAELGSSSSMQVGDPVVAIGNPLGKELLGTVTTGVISATNREIQVGNTTQNLLQTDAAINPGNSGGALVNSQGQVIGINSAKMGGSGVEGLGFAIPIDIVKPKINSLLKPILKIGISARNITSDLSKQYNMPEGVYVVQVEQFSSAEKAGLQPGDVIEKFDGKPVKTVDDINNIKATLNAGDKVSMEVYRNNKTISLTLQLSQ